MKKIIPFGKPIVGKKELTAIKKVLDTGIYVHGPKIIEFEKSFKKFTKAKHAISVSSCTAGMHLIYFSLNIGYGDEIIVPAQTHVATGHAVELTGAKPIFIDCESLTGNIDISKIEKAITKKTKAITVVHYLGLPVDMKKIKKIANRYKLYVIEDCALSLGAKVGKTHTGICGDAGVFSFYPVKHMTTAEGGMVITNNKKLAKKIRLKKAFGIDKSHGERKKPGVYNAVELGFNYRMSEIQAVIGIEQLKKVPMFLKKRYKNFKKLAFLIKNLKNVKILKGSNNYLKSSHYCLSIILADSIAKYRNVIIAGLKNKGIGSSIYYPHPVPRMSYYKKKYGYSKKNFLNASKISDNSIALPVGPHLKKNDTTIIAKNFIKLIEKYSK
tara:strand:+ start:48 stop:1199 length:1152 start_codon:yes stop_codon:yes gene_type:complete